jgi:hypothetical protein
VIGQVHDRDAVGGSCLRERELGYIAAHRESREIRPLETKDIRTVAVKVLLIEPTAKSVSGVTVPA